MKILIILKTWPGGVGRVVKNVKKVLEEKGHIVDVISREEDMNIKSFVKSIFPIRKKVKSLMKKNSYDIIYTQDWSLAFPLIFPHPLFWKKHFCMFHGNQPGKAKMFQNIIGSIMGKKLIVVGDFLKKRFPEANLNYNGVDLNLFTPDKKIKKIKNSVGFANWKTEVYNYQKIKEAVENIGKKIIVAENIPAEKMPEFYNKIETFISIPPPYTGFNLVWIEAMACGVKKILGSNSGIGSKLPIDKIEGYKTLEEAIKKTKKNDYRKWMEKNKNQFDWKKHVDKLLERWKK